MKATELLQRQHRKVEATFKKLEAGKSDAAPLLKELADDLAAHMAIEQEIFYPVAREADPDLIAESFQEHAVAELALKRLLMTDPEDETFKAKVTTLKELIEHHVKEEEEELFPSVEKAMTRTALATLAERMESRFEEAKQEGHLALLPKSFSKTTADDALRTSHAAAAH